MRLKNNGESCTVMGAAFFTGTEIDVADETVPTIQYAIDSGWFSVVDVAPTPAPVAKKPAAKRKGHKDDGR